MRLTSKSSLSDFLPVINFTRPTDWDRDIEGRSSLTIRWFHMCGARSRRPQPNISATLISLASVTPLPG